MERTDGFTPLHLVAARANVHDVHLGLIRLGEDTQVSFFLFVLAIFLNVSKIVKNCQKLPKIVKNGHQFV